MTDLYLGIDFGTSGARAISLSDPQGVAVTPSDNNLAEIQFQTSRPFTQSENLPALWQNTLFQLIDQIPKTLRSQIRAIAINGTSSTVLLCDQKGAPIAEPLLYNDDRGATVLDRVRAIAPINHTVISATSSFAKLLWWSQQPNFSDARYFLHQADWLAFLLHRQLGFSDYHNSLKLGYDAERLCYPDWLKALPFEKLLPKVVAPGTVISAISPTVAANCHLRSDCLICAGTTDSIAAFLASGVTTPGEAVTSLGSTLVLKLLSETRIEAGQYGIYSHRLGNLWLVGGASNTGGAVLRHFFSDRELAQLSDRIPTDQESLLDYYPLLKPGDRFPINDPRLPPQLEPRPDDPVTFLHGLLESIARIEAKGYRLLQSLGTNTLTRVYSAGGGAKNQAWQAIRMRQLGVSVVRSSQTEAAYGTATLALKCNPH
ncbi:FGGY-family carbohydrate kinase [Phormidesmis priestleyi]